jgi:hypothetical protein
MAQDYAELERSARLLSPEERARLAEARWAAEIKRRVEAYERGEATLIPAEEVFAKARRITGE